MRSAKGSAHAIAAGCVIRTQGDCVLAALPGARVGDGVCIASRTRASLRGEVTAVERGRVTIASYGPLAGIAVGDPVRVSSANAPALGVAALGRAFDAAASPLDGGPSLERAGVVRKRAAAPLPGERLAVTEPFWTGLRVVDGLLTLGRGARIGVFGAPGTGKSTLLETIVSGADADAVVLGLVGERGREAQRWLERLDRRTTIVCATSDRSAGERIRASELALLHAEALRARGLQVLLVLDSLARYGAALRERQVGLGEPVGRGGYPPSVWATLARYLERAGNAGCGSITVIATVLSDGSDEREPLSDAARSLLDGHIVLSAELARAGHFPAVDVLASTSRTMGDVVAAQHAFDARRVARALALLARTQDARSLGFAGGDAADVRAAVAAEGEIEAFLRRTEPSSPAETRSRLAALATRLEASPPPLPAHVEDLS